MLQTLSELFLLISSDGQKITSKDLSLFYNFITKKIPQIQQQFPSMLINSLGSSSNLNSAEDKKLSDSNDFKNDKDSKKVFISFQRQILSLFNDIIDYCYNEGIIKLNNKIEQLIKNKIDEKIREKSNKKNRKNKYEFDYNKYYQNELNINRSKREKLRHFLIFLTINGEINYNIFPNDYVNFFNSENKAKNRLNAQQFMEFINNFLKKYKENKANYNNRINNKSNNNTDIKLKSKDNNNSIVEENNKTDGNKNSKGIKSFNTDTKIFDINNKSKVNNIKHVYKKSINNNSNKDELRNKFINDSKDNFMNNNALKQNLFSNNKLQNKLSPEKSIIIDNDVYCESGDEEINDTIRCETPKNIENEEIIEISDKNDLKKKIISKENNQRRFSADKDKNKPYSRFTVSTIPYKEEIRKILNNNDEKEGNENNNSSQKYETNQKKNMGNRNKKNINRENKNEKYHQSFTEEKHTDNVIQEKRKIEKCSRPLNKSQNTIEQKISNNNLTNNELNNENRINNYSNGKNIIIEKEDKDNNIKKCYKLLNIRTDRNNKKYKELYLYKDLEIYEHLVICDEDKNKDKEEEYDEDDIKCIIF